MAVVVVVAVVVAVVMAVVAILVLVEVVEVVEVGFVLDMNDRMKSSASFLLKGVASGMMVMVVTRTVRIRMRILDAILSD